MSDRAGLVRQSWRSVRRVLTASALALRVPTALHAQEADPRPAVRDSLAFANTFGGEFAPGSGFDLIKLTSGSSKLLGLHSDTVQAVCKQFAISRDACGKRPRWRGRKSLGWVPFQAPRAIRLQGDTVVFLGQRYHLWLTAP